VIISCSELLLSDASVTNVPAADVDITQLQELSAIIAVVGCSIDASNSSAIVELDLSHVFREDNLK